MDLVTTQQSVEYTAALAAGLVSFFSPCILPVVPGYFTFLAGTSLDRLVSEGDHAARQRLIISTLAFVLGFSAVFVALGASASFLGGILFEHKDIVRIAGGVIIIILGLHVSGLLRLGFLDVEKRFHFTEKPMHVAGTFLVGMAFGAGWSPCVGPLLGSVLAIAANQETVGQGVLLLSVYSAGLAIPFLVLAVFAHYLFAFLKRATRIMPWVNRIAGGLLILIGIVLVADLMKYYPMW
ncbi:MAG: cytochrome c biogenesis CcdA family protein [Desulfatibacillaceae bacterium]